MSTPRARVGTSWFRQVLVRDQAAVRQAVSSSVAGRSVKAVVQRAWSRSRRRALTSSETWE